MNIISIIYIICSLIAFESAFTIFRLNKRATSNILFALFSFDFCLFCLTYSQLTAAPAKDIAMSWHMITIPSGTLITILTFHFTLALTGRKKIASNPILFLPLYLPSFYFMFQLLSGNIITDISKTTWGWDVVYDQKTPGTILGISHGILLLIAGSILFFRWYYTSEKILEKKQARPVAFSFATGAFGSTFILFNTVSTDPFYNTLVSDISFAVFYTFFILGVRFSVGKYKLMNLHPEVPIVDIIMGINEACFLTDISGTIICSNREGNSLIQNQNEQLIFGLFSCPETIQSGMKGLLSNASGKATVRCFITDSKRSYSARWFHLTFQCVRDEGGTPSGFMVMAKEDLSLKDFQTKFDITGRQAEIILLAISGLSNRDMGERLNISERTVENHLFNIYNKMGIDNKIELLKNTARYGIIPD